MTKEKEVMHDNIIINLSLKIDWADSLHLLEIGVQKTTLKKYMIYSPN